MKSQLFRLTFVVCLLAPLTEFISAENKRVGYIDLEFVLQNSIARDTFYKEYLNQRSRMIAARKSAEDNLHKLRKELRQKEHLLGYSEYEREYLAAKERIDETEKAVLQAREDLKKWENDNTGVLFDELLTVLEIIAEEENLELILSRQTSVLFGESGLDFSQRAIDLLNEKEERETPTGR